jgi:hypothetical protein
MKLADKAPQMMAIGEMKDAKTVIRLQYAKFNHVIG